MSHWSGGYTSSYSPRHRCTIAGIRGVNGTSPCHRCLVEADGLNKLGAPSDTERRDKSRSEAAEAKLVAQAEKLIKSGYSVKTKAIELMLKAPSLIPVSVRPML